MAYSIKALENGLKNFNQNPKRRADGRAQEVADYITGSTAQGRGLWVLILWPALLLFFFVLSAFFILLLEKIGMTRPLSLGGVIVGFGLARAWYCAKFTIAHPFLSAAISYFALMFLMPILSQKVGL